MKKFLKKNKLPLFLLACVVMLSIFYIFTPNSKPINTTPVSGSIDEGNGYIYFTEERLTILEARNEEINKIEDVIASNELDVVDVAIKLSEIEIINQISYNECSLEKEIEALGYYDVLVHNYIKEDIIDTNNIVDINQIEIKIIADELSIERQVAITQLAKTKFGSNDYKVILVIENTD